MWCVLLRKNILMLRWLKAASAFRVSQVYLWTRAKQMYHEWCVMLHMQTKVSFLQQLEIARSTVPTKTLSTTSSTCWRSRHSRRHLRSIWPSTSRCAPAHATLDRRPYHCCSCHFDGHHLPDNRSFSTAAPLARNSLPPAVLNCDSLSTFKSRLKTHLFSTAFC